MGASWLIANLDKREFVKPIPQFDCGAQLHDQIGIGMSLPDVLALLIAVSEHDGFNDGEFIFGRWASNRVVFVSDWKGRWDSFTGSCDCEVCWSRGIYRDCLEGKYIDISGVAYLRLRSYVNTHRLWAERVSSRAHRMVDHH